MKIVSIILSLTLIFGLFAANTFAYSRPENIVSEYNDFETDVGDWTNGLISGCTGGGDVTSSDTTVSVSTDTDGTHGKYLVVNNGGSLRATATLMFDINSAKVNASGVTNSAKVKRGNYFGFEFDFKLPSDASSATALDLMVWDSCHNRNRETLVKIAPSSGKVTAGSKNYTISKNTWYKMKLECVVGSAFQRFIIMDDNGNELFASNINSSSASINAQQIYSHVTFSQGGAGCVFYLDNTKAYTFDERDLNVGRILFSDDTEHTLDLANPSFEAGVNNAFTDFNNNEDYPSAFALKTKLRIDDTAKHNDIKISLLENGISEVDGLITTISPYGGTVRLGSSSSAVTVGGLSMSSGVWYDVEIICNGKTDYQRVEITNLSTDETQVFDGLSDYIPDDISAFDGVLFECSCEEDAVTDFDDIKIYVVSESYAGAFYTMDTYELDADESEILINTSAPLTNFSEDKVILKTDEGKVIPAEISYDGANSITLIPSKPFEENARMQVIFSREILINGERPKFDSVVNIKILIDEIYMDFDLKADGETVIQASDITGKSNISCSITSVNRTAEDFNGMYVMTIMDKNGEIKGICADDISLSASLPSAVASLSLPVPDDGTDLEIYIMLIDNFQSSKALAKYIKIH